MCRRRPRSPASTKPFKEMKKGFRENVSIPRFFFPSSSFGAKTTFHFPPNDCKRCFERRIFKSRNNRGGGKTQFTGLSREFAAVEERAGGHRTPVLTEPGRLLGSASFLSATFIHDLPLRFPAAADKVAANV